MSVPQKSATETKPANAQATDKLLRQFAGYRMKRAYLLVQADLAETLEPLGLRVGTFSALAVLIASPGISQTSLSHMLNIKRSGVVVVVDELERAGVLERRAVAGDRRKNALAITPAGQRLWEKAERAVQLHEAELFAGLDQQEADQLRDLLGRVGKLPSATTGG